VSAFTGNDHKPDYTLHFGAGDEDGATTTTADAGTNPLVGGPAPSELPDQQFEVLSGGLSSLQAHPGTPMVVNIWQTSCKPCRTEMPALQSVHVAMGDKVAFVGIAIRDSKKAAKEFVSETGVTYTIGLDPSGLLAQDLGVVSLPTTYLVDANGKIVATHKGAFTASQLQQLIDDKLK
jgi:thiol-disulfide isomerase/thioredoxin